MEGKTSKFCCFMWTNFFDSWQKNSFLARLSRIIWNYYSSQMFQQVGMINYNTSASNQCP
jgi:hypothetical protein